MRDILDALESIHTNKKKPMDVKKELNKKPAVMKALSLEDEHVDEVLSGKGRANLRKMISDFERMAEEMNLSQEAMDAVAMGLDQIMADVQEIEGVSENKTIDEDKFDGYKIHRLAELQKKVDDVAKDIRLLGKTDAMPGATGAGDLTDQITTMNKAVMMLQDVIERANSIVPDPLKNYDGTPKTEETVKESNADPEIVKKFAGVSDSQRSYYVMKWAEENGIDTDKAMEMAGYEKGDYMGAGAYRWHYVGESQVDEGHYSEAHAEIKQWAEKYNKYKGTNADPLAHGYLQAMLNSGIMSDAYEENEVEAFNKMKGYGADSNDAEWADGDHDDFIDNKSGVSPITAGMFSEIGKILGKYNLEDEDVNSALNHFENKKVAEMDAHSADMEKHIPMISKMRDELMDKGMEPEDAFDKACDKYGFDPDDVSEYMDKKNEATEEQVEEDCACETELTTNSEEQEMETTKKDTVEVAVEDLARVLELAGLGKEVIKAEAEATEEATTEAPNEVELDEYSNSPDEDYFDADTQLNKLSGGLNGPKKQLKKEYPGDNPLAVDLETKLAKMLSDM